MLIAYRKRDRTVFLLAFAKNERENITANELAALRAVAKVWLQAPEQDIEAAIDDGILQEVPDDEDDNA